jgi:deoxyribonuclease V
MTDRDRFRPDPSLTREEMEALQREVAAAAVFEDDLPFDPARVGADDGPLVAGVDQAFLHTRDDDREERAVSAVVVTRGDSVLERVHALEPLEIPYVPGLLSFREGNPILAAMDELETDPDVYLFDGSGRIHFRQAGIATHVGVIRDVPAVGVAKSLLCGTPAGPVDELSAGDRVPIEADEDVERVATATDGERGDGSASAEPGTVIGFAFQSRKYPDSHTINPLYVSPGHRVGAETAVDLVERCGGTYKLPEPTRLADAYADELKDRLTS